MSVCVHEWDRAYPLGLSVCLSDWLTAACPQVNRAVRACIKSFIWHLLRWLFYDYQPLVPTFLKNLPLHFPFHLKVFQLSFISSLHLPFLFKSSSESNWFQPTDILHSLLYVVHLWGVWHLQMNVKYHSLSDSARFLNGFGHCPIFYPVMRWIWQSDWSVMSGSLCLWGHSWPLLRYSLFPTYRQVPQGHPIPLSLSVSKVKERFRDCWDGNKINMLALFIYLLTVRSVNYNSVSTQKCPPQTPYPRIHIHDSALGLLLKI